MNTPPNRNVTSSPSLSNDAEVECEERHLLLGGGDCGLVRTQSLEKDLLDSVPFDDCDLAERHLGKRGLVSVVNLHVTEWGRVGILAIDSDLVLILLGGRALAEERDVVL